VTSDNAPAVLLDGVHDYLQSLGDRLVAEFTAAIDWQAGQRRLAANDLACLRHLDRAAEIAPVNERTLVRLLADKRHDLCWGQTYTADDFGQNFIDNYGWMELAGTRGHFESDKVAAGFLVLGPDIVYPDHRHVAEELYLPLTGGTEWRKGEGGFAIRAAGEIIHHPSNLSHAMRTGAEPLIAFYVWRGGPLAQKSTIVAAGSRA
jgi:Dimethlysulfonioproprionate lyase